MLKRPEQILKLICLLLAAVLCLEFARVIARGAPLKNLTVPALPKLAASGDSTNSPSGQSSSTNTNSVVAAKTGTNSSTTKPDAKGTNETADAKKQGTNGVEATIDAKGTNAAAITSNSETNKSPTPAGEKTNEVGAVS